MQNQIKQLLLKYINVGMKNILLEDIPNERFKNNVILASSCDISLLNGHYEGEEFVAPKWYIELSKKKNPLLVIENINDIDVNDQKKFIEILKYRKISTFDLPRNCVVILTCSNLKSKPINEEVYSLVVHIN